MLLFLIAGFGSENDSASLEGTSSNVVPPLDKFSLLRFLELSRRIPEGGGPMGRPVEATSDGTF